VGRFWSLLFLTVPIIGVAVFAWAMAGIWPMQGHWLPENINPQGEVIDTLFLFILYLTGIIFVITGLILFWFLWKYDASQNAEPVKYMHGSHTLEVVWSILPAATLLFRADGCLAAARCAARASWAGRCSKARTTSRSPRWPK
jgi:cytochrome c oxidase subunit 2